MCAASSTQPAKGPMQSREDPYAMSPYRETRPYVGFKPTTPQKCAGCRMLPPAARFSYSAIHRCSVWLSPPYQRADSPDKHQAQERRERQATHLCHCQGWQRTDRPQQQQLSLLRSRRAPAPDPRGFLWPARHTMSCTVTCSWP